MVDEVRHIGSGGGFPPGRGPKGGRPKSAGQPPGPVPASPLLEADAAQLPPGRDQAVRALAQTLEALQKDLAARPGEAGLQQRLAQNQVTMANLLGAAGAGPETALTEALGALAHLRDLPRERVLELLTRKEPAS